MRQQEPHFSRGNCTRSTCCFSSWVDAKIIIVATAATFRYRGGAFFIFPALRKQIQLSRQWMDGNKLSGESIRYSSATNCSQKDPSASMTGRTRVVGNTTKQMRQIVFAIISPIR